MKQLDLDVIEEPGSMVHCYQCAHCGMAYRFGDRQALTVSRSEHVNFTTDEQVWKFVQRVDGRPWLTSALTPRNGSTTISPFVNLATRS